MLPHCQKEDALLQRGSCGPASFHLFSIVCFDPGEEERVLLANETINSPPVFAVMSGWDRGWVARLALLAPVSGSSPPPAGLLRLHHLWISGRGQLRFPLRDPGKTPFAALPCFVYTHTCHMKGTPAMHLHVAAVGSFCQLFAIPSFACARE